ncbi:hypothetical protein E8E14_014857 [Neopestalotiopsis sp. 37M]|nr:hypothetical protein E8E14_014857 [Neopestalotiopsis sp. 37M]
MVKDKTTPKKTSKTSKSVGGSTTPIPAPGRSARRSSGRRPSTPATPYVSNLSIGTPQPGFAGPQHPFPGGPSAPALPQGSPQDHLSPQQHWNQTASQGYSGFPPHQTGYWQPAPGQGYQTGYWQPAPVQAYQSGFHQQPPGFPPQLPPGQGYEPGHQPGFHQQPPGFPPQPPTGQGYQPYHQPGFHHQPPGYHRPAPGQGYQPGHQPGFHQQPSGYPPQPPPGG